MGSGVEAEEGAIKNPKWCELLGRYIFGLQETEYPSLTGGALSQDYQWKSLKNAEKERAGFAAPPSLARRINRHEPSIVSVLFQPGFLGDHRRNRASLYRSPCLPIGAREAILGAKFDGLPHI